MKTCQVKAHVSSTNMANHSSTSIRWCLKASQRERRKEPPEKVQTAPKKQPKKKSNARKLKTTQRQHLSNLQKQTTKQKELTSPDRPSQTNHPHTSNNQFHRFRGTLRLAEPPQPPWVGALGQEAPRATPSAVPRLFFAALGRLV